MKITFSALLIAVSGAFAAPASVAPSAVFRFEPGTFKGDSSRLIVNVSIPKGWHIQSNAPLDSFLIPTTLQASGEGLAFGRAVFPKAREEDFPALGGKVLLFEGEIEIRAPVKRKSAKASPEKSAVVLRYQACNDSQCLPPKEITAVHKP